jgi:hypothetical protein
MHVILSWILPLEFQMTKPDTNRNNMLVPEHFFLRRISVLQFLLIIMIDQQLTTKRNNHQ